MMHKNVSMNRIQFTAMYDKFMNDNKFNSADGLIVLSYAHIVSYFQ